MPDFHHLLLFIAHNKGCQYYVGDYKDDHFFPDNHGRMTWIDNTYFAPEALIDGKGRQIMWSWLTDNPGGEKERGWSGVYGLPRTLWLGELFGSGQMQLPFVLASAEVMKKSVAHLEPHMEKSDDEGKGTIVLATVKGDVHDIGKNLVDIILTNNGYTVVNLGIKQPVGTIIEAAVAHNADAIGMSRATVSISSRASSTPPPSWRICTVTGMLCPARGSNARISSCVV